MDTPRCQELADRLHAQLLQQLGMGLDATRMLHEPLYARDVLLVCAAHPGSELARLAWAFRDAAAPTPAATPLQPRPVPAPTTRTGARAPLQRQGGDRASAVRASPAAAAPERATGQQDSQTDTASGSQPPAQAARSPLSRFPRLSLSRFSASIFGGSLFEGTLFGSPRIDPVTDFGDDSYLTPRPGQAPERGTQRPASAPEAPRAAQRRTRWFGR